MWQQRQQGPRAEGPVQGRTEGTKSEFLDTLFLFFLSSPSDRLYDYV